LGEQITFAVAAIAAMSCGVCVVSLRNAFQATVALIGTLLSVALLFLLQAAPFVAAIQIIVYAGAIVVLFLFVIAYLGERQADLGPDRAWRVQPLAVIAVGVVGALGAVALLNADIRLQDKLVTLGEGPDIGSPKAIGDAFLRHYLVPFEVTSLVLLVAAVGAVMLAKRAVQAEGSR
jgi:NADH-quinone oxidoreductase subunit J